MDNIIQTERLRYAKICRERTLLHVSINNCPGKVKARNQKGRYKFFFYVFFSEAANFRHLRPATLLKRYTNTCFPVNMTEFLRTPILKTCK